jgi:hypothetical protein
MSLSAATTPNLQQLQNQLTTNSANILNLTNLEKYLATKSLVTDLDFFLDCLKYYAIASKYYPEKIKIIADTLSTQTILQNTSKIPF